MSLIYNDTTNFKGIVQIYEKEIGVVRGTISGDTDKLKELTADVNLALDDFFDLAFKSGGTWQVDDTNFEPGSDSGYPIIQTNLVSGQRDYTFTTDGGGNLILDIHKVAIADQNGVFREIYPVDQQTRNSNRTNVDSLLDGRNQTGVPTRYDKTANGIFLDLIPSYNYGNGLKVFINREPSYFVYTHRDRKPGVPGLYHKYFALKPALDYKRRNNHADVNRIEREVLLMEQKIKENFGKRERDIPRRLIANIENNK